MTIEILAAALGLYAALRKGRKVSGVGITNGWKLEDDDWKKVNTPSSGSKLYAVRIWSGSGYFLPAYKAWASSEEEALEYTVAWLERNDPGMLQDDYVESLANSGDYTEDELDGMFLYVDATMIGAERPHYIFIENLRVQEFPANMYKHVGDPYPRYTGNGNQWRNMDCRSKYLELLRRGFTEAEAARMAQAIY